MSLLDKLAVQLSEPALRDELVSLAGHGHAGHGGGGHNHAASEARDGHGRFAPGGATKGASSASVKRGDTVQHGGETHTVTGTRKSPNGGTDVYTTSGHKINVKPGQKVSEGTKTGGPKSPRTRATGDPANHDPGEIMKSRGEVKSLTPAQRAEARAARTSNVPAVRGGAAAGREARAQQNSDTGKSRLTNSVPKGDASNLGKKISVPGLTAGHTLHDGGANDYGEGKQYHYAINGTHVATIRGSRGQVLGTGSSANLRVGSTAMRYTATVTAAGKRALGMPSTQRGYTNTATGRSPGQSAKNLHDELHRAFRSGSRS